MSQQEIVAMKGSGVSGKEIIQTLVQNSKTWAEKTTFSRAKYLKKKVKKYAAVVGVYALAPNSSDGTDTCVD